jgi:hypothetical protein
VLCRDSQSAETVSTVDAAYRRGDLLDHRARLMQEWADYATGRPAGKGGKVVPIRRMGEA